MASDQAWSRQEVAALRERDHREEPPKRLTPEMSDSLNSGASGFSRRKFLRGAAVTGAAVLTADSLRGHPVPESSPNPSSSLIRSAAPSAGADVPLAPPD